jgi:hypothetical protein
MPSLDLEIPQGYFDGASQGHPPRRGVDVVLYVNSHQFFYIDYTPGPSL